MQADVKTSIEDTLRPLIGLPLAIAREAVDMRGLHFGRVRPHRSRIRPERTGTSGDYVLHIQCSWRIVGENGIVTGLMDRFEGRQPEEDPVDDDAKTGNLQRVRLLDFMGGFDEETRSHVDLAGQRIVTAIKADNHGSLEIAFNDETLLQLFPSSSSSEDWRFFATAPEDSEHFVIVGGKIEA
jgi:hypothetical protein